MEFNEYKQGKSCEILSRLILNMAAVRRYGFAAAALRLVKIAESNSRIIGVIYEGKVVWPSARRLATPKHSKRTTYRHIANLKLNTPCGFICVVFNRCAAV